MVSVSPLPPPTPQRTEKDVVYIVYGSTIVYSVRKNFMTRDNNGSIANKKLPLAFARKFLIRCKKRKRKGPYT